MAIEGAVAAQSYDYDSFGNRIKATAGASVAAPLIGGAISGIIKTGVGIGRGIKKVVSSVKDPRIPTMASISQELAEKTKEISGVASGAGKQIQSTQAIGREAIEQISDRASSLEQRIKSGMQAEKSAVNRSLDTTKRQIKSSVDSLDSMLTNESDVAAKTFQNKITGFFRQNSNSYGKELDVASNKIAESGRLTRGEAFEVLSNVLKTSGSEAEVSGGVVIERIKSLINSKYAPEVTQGAGQATTIIRRDLNDQIPFKEFLGEVRDIWKSIKPYKSGARFSQEEIPAAILQSEFGELVSRLPGGELFQGLQKAYRPVIGYMNKANAIIQPYKGEAYRKGAYDLIKRVASGDAAPVDTDIVNFVEQGTERFGHGIGSVSSKAREIGSNIKILKEQATKSGLDAEKRLLQIAEDGALKLSKIDMTKRGAEKLVERETNIHSARILEESARQEMELAKRIQVLQKRGESVQVLMRKRAILQGVSTGASLALSGIAGIYGIYRAATGVSKLGRLNE
jgi:hypothetical protein